MTTLPEFIEIGRKHGRANLHIKVPDFQVFYARFGRRIMNNTVYCGVFDIASIEVTRRLWGTGVFTRFFYKFRQDYPNVPVYVENAAPRFQKLLLRLGFRRHEFNLDSFYFIKDICSTSTSTTGEHSAETGNSLASGSAIPSADTGTTTTSRVSENESSEPTDSPPTTSVRSTSRYKRRSPTFRKDPRSE